jgi:small conductance mechanosensitive channel
MDWRAISDTALAILTTVGLKILGAIALWIVGQWLISAVLRMTDRALRYQQLDKTLVRYLQTSLSVLLKLVLLIAMLGVLGVETATFAAVVAAAGVAIGLAWSGLLANFAAGAFLVFLRPFKVGDAVTAGGVTGTVDAIGLFGTTLNTPDNVSTIVPNNKIFSDTIQNYSQNPHRRVDLTATLNSSVDLQKAIALLRSRLGAIPNVLTEPAPEIDVLGITPSWSSLCVRPCCRNEHYAQVRFDTNRMIRDAFNEAQFPAPEQHLVVRNAT